MIENIIKQQKNSERKEVEVPQQLQLPFGIPEALISNSLVMKRVLEQISKIAFTETPVLVEGETGTGKELVANAIHNCSPRTNQPFVVFTCANFPDTLLDSELFGHEKGAFSGATHLKKGVFEQTGNGSLLLDEIGEINLYLQPKLLRAIETGRIRRLGGERETKTNVRIIGATNRSLLKEIEQGRFRKDLYYRLNAVTLSVPLLKDRKEDIPFLIEYFLKKMPITKRITSETVQMLLDYDWPGNVRELKNVIESSAIFSQGEKIKSSDLPKNITMKNHQLKFPEEVLLSLENMEKMHISRVLEKVKYNINQACNILKISRRTLYYKISKYKLYREQNK